MISVPELSLPPIGPDFVWFVVFISLAICWGCVALSWVTP